VDILLEELRLSDYGCHLGQTHVNSVAYADDLILLSVSLCDLQEMLTVYFNTGKNLNIVFNDETCFLFNVCKVYREDIDECYTLVSKAKSFQDLLSLHTLSVSVFDSQFKGNVSSIDYIKFVDLCVITL